MSNDKIDTGTGGFPIGEGQTRLSYDVGTEDSEDIPRIPWSPGDVSVDNRKKDVSRSTRSTLAAYMSDTTLGKTPSSPSPVKNAYPINHLDRKDPVELSLKDQKGYPVNPDVSLSAYLNTDNESETYVPGKVLSSRSSAATNLEVIRGRQEGTGKVDGNKLLKNATPDGANPGVINPSAKGGALPKIGYAKPEDLSKEIKNYYGSPNPGNISNSVIYNRFNPENIYEDNTGINSPQFAKKYPLGHNLPPNAAERNVTHARLAQIGNALSIRSGLELKSLSEGNNPTDNASVAGAVLPGSTQFGVYRLEREQLEAASVLETLTLEGIDDNLLINPAKQSWGTLNNVLDQYAGISNFGMQLLAVALIVALSLVIALVVSLIPGTNFPIIKRGMDDKSIRPYGKSYENGKRLDYSSIASIVSQGSDFNVLGLLGFPPTIYPIEKCISVGTLLFFGIVPPGGTDVSLGNLVTQATLGAATSAMKNPGYYTVMARSINRSFLTISDSLLSLGKSFGSGNFVTGIQQTLEFVNVFRDSKFLGSLKVFSRLGDAYLYDADDPKIDSDGRHRTKLDNDSDTDNVHKGRIKRNTTRLSWSTYRASDLILYPAGIGKVSPKGSTESFTDVPDYGNFLINVNEEDDYLGFKHKRVGEKVDGVYTKSLKNDRIETLRREEMETALDSEYVPFYFHDVRTNEILSFHAFLASLSDDYTAAYDSSEGFGRVEPVKTYKGTQRKIGFSFYVAATSAEDFEVMWHKINKLVTLVYPQYTEGRLLSPDKNYNMHMPFSQTIQASPLVRVRIGDLIRSNYSKFNLARLFGYSYSGTKFNGVEIPDSGDQEGGEGSITAIRLSKAKAYSAGNTFIPKDKEHVIAAAPDDDSRAKIMNICETAWPDGVGLRLLSTAGNITSSDTEAAKYYFEIVPLKEDDLDSSGAINTWLSSPDANAGIKIALKEDQVKFTKTTDAKRSAEFGRVSSNVKQHRYTAEAKIFMEENNNAVVKSFKSSGGKGLAGFIESMNFDWYDRVTWAVGTDGDKGNAPKMCKVTISFSPIHDISPGLDHEGGNRAPVYPVGSFFRKT